MRSNCGSLAPCVVYALVVLGCSAYRCPPCTQLAAPSETPMEVIAQPSVLSTSDSVAKRMDAAKSIDLAAIPVSLTEEEWLSGLRPLEGEEVVVSGCAESMRFFTDRSVAIGPCVPEMFGSVTVLRTFKIQQQLVMNARGPVPTSPSLDRIRVVGRLRLAKVVDGLVVWAWGSLDDAEFEALR